MIVEYDYKIKMKKVWAWPWSRHGEATVQEIISDISGDLKDKENTSVAPIPKWKNGEKIVKLNKVGRRWVIDEIIMERPLEKFE